MLTITQKNQLNWDKVSHMMPAIIQDSFSGQVLMFGYMNEEALHKTVDTKKVTFFSRTKQRLWTKGETSGDFLHVNDISVDCDKDTLLVQASPAGPTCHLGHQSCFNDSNGFDLDFIGQLSRVIEARYQDRNDSSYTASLFNQGVKRMAQKVGEEGVEVALAAATDDREELINESSDLLYHLMVLLRGKNVTLNEVMDNLRARHK